MSRRELGRVALLFLALTLLFTYPLPLHLGASVLEVGPDGNLFAWTLAWDAHAFLHQPLGIFDANIFHPQRKTLAYSENLIGSALFSAPVQWLTGNPVLAVNVVALLSVVLCGIGATLLARRLGLGWPAAVVAGLVFAFSPPRFFRTGQLHLGVVQWIPFGLAYLHGYLDTGRARDLRIAAAFLTLQALSSGHGAAFMILACGALLLYRLAAGDPVAPARRLKDLGVTGALLLVPAALLYLPYRFVQADVGLRRTLANWTVTPESFVASPSHAHRWLWSLVSDWKVNDTASAFLFPGLLVLALASVAVLHRPRGGWRTDPVPFYALLTLLACLMFVSPPVGLWPLVYDWPGLSFVRVPSRFSVLAMLGLAVLAGFGAERVFASVPPRTARVAAMAIGVALLAEFASFPMRLEPVRAKAPAVDGWLATQPAPIVVAEVPLNGSARRQSEFMLHSMAHWQKTVHGYSGIIPPQHEELYERMRRFPDDASLETLARFGVTHVVVHAEWYRPGEWPSVEQRLRGYAGRLTLVHQDGDGRVYRLVR
jgi:hypothetical protein